MQKKLAFLLAVLTVGFAAWLGIFNLAEAASLYISPASGSFSVGSTFKVSIRTNTDDQAVNSAEASVGYSTDMLEVVSVSAGSTFPLQTPGSPSQGGGRVFFSGGVPSPGYNGGSGLVGSITFRAKAIGQAQVTIASGKVLLNDGLATNALTSSSGARFSITAAPAGMPNVTSSSHPDQEKWYAAKTAELKWDRPAGVYGFSFELSRDSETIPDNTLDTTITTNKTYPGLEDGVWYFHIKARGETTGFGATRHFKIQIDSGKPTGVELALTGKETPDGLGSPVKAEFKASDSLSGIARYELWVDGKKFIEKADSPKLIENLDAGKRKVKVIAIDSAGNYEFTEKEITLSQAQAPAKAVAEFSLKGLPLYLLLLLNLITILLLLILIILLAKSRKTKQGTNYQVLSIQEEIDKSLDVLRLELDEKFAKLAKILPESINTRQFAISHDVDAKISKVKKAIDAKIARLSREAKKNNQA